MVRSLKLNEIMRYSLKTSFHFLFVFRSNNYLHDNSTEESVHENRKYYFGVLMGVIAAVSRASILVCNRKLCQNQSSCSVNLISFHAAFSGLLINLIWCLFSGQSQVLSNKIVIISARAWLIYLLIAIIASFHTYLINSATKLVAPIC